MSVFALSVTAWLAQSGGSNLFSTFANSNLAGKVVIALLALFSILAWSVMLGKYLDLKHLRMLNEHIQRKLDKLPHVRDIGPVGRGSGPYATVIKAANDARERFETEHSERSVQVAHIENAIQRAVSVACLQYESKMVTLGSIVTAAPFLGLLGTVWGVMDAFGSMGTQSSATIQALAPGVSGALLTTVAGLLVAIPSVIGYNHLLTRTKLMITELENFASSLADRVELEIDEDNG